MKYRSDQSSRAFRRIFYNSCPMVLFSTAFFTLEYLPLENL